MRVGIGSGEKGRVWIFSSLVDLTGVALELAGISGGVGDWDKATILRRKRG